MNHHKYISKSTNGSFFTVIFLTLFLTSALTLSSCQNLFNPSGTNQSTDLNADGLIDYGNSFLRKGDNVSAQEQFEAAIKLDSTKSEAYYGYAKATLRIGGFNPLVLASASSSLNDSESDDTFQIISDLVGNEIGESADEIKETTNILSELMRRDSINDLWLNYVAFEEDVIIENGLAVGLDNEAALSFQRQDFILFFNEYALKDSDPTYKLTDFPIMDGKVSKARVEPEFTLLTLVVSVNTVNEIASLLGDSTLFQSLAEGENLDLQNISKEDSEDFNTLIDAASEDLSLINFDPNLLSNGDGTDTLSENEVQDLINEAGNTIIFYKLDDQVDNDGDGCIDEELRDGIDNDGDGIIDEDSRADTLDIFDNNLDEVIDDNNEIPTSTGLLTEEFGFDRTGVYILYLDSLDFLTEEEIKERRSALDSVRYDIVTDFTGTKYTDQQKKALVGGCW